MKRILIVANTYYQVIMAVQLKNTLFVNDSVVLLISDHSKNTKSISGKLDNIGVFESVKFIESLDVLKKRTICDKVRDYFQISFMKNNRYKYYLDGIENEIYDEILCYNYGIDIYGLFSYLSYYNNNLRVSFYEESILSYNFSLDKLNKNMSFISKIRKVLKKLDIMNRMSSFYCFYPDLYRGMLDAIEVPNISKKGRTSEILRTIFELDNNKYKEKYIFFTSVYDFEGGNPIKEYELCEGIAELVGKENLIIKIHPRDRRSIYEDNGFKVDRNSTVPWEAIQLSGDFENNVFLTATSSSALAGSLMSEEPIETYYLYNCCDIAGNSSAIKTVKDIESLLTTETMRDTLRSITIVKEISDIR